MSNPRWLDPALVSELEKIDRQYRQHRTDGPLILEVHYQTGNPRLVKVRVPPPSILEHRVGSSALPTPPQQSLTDEVLRASIASLTRTPTSRAS